MKIKDQGILMALACLSMVGCQTEVVERESQTSLLSDIEVKFKSEIISRVNNDAWENGDNIGIFMLKTGTSLSEESTINNAANMKYRYASESSTFQPATDNDRTYYPAKEAVDFIAYHPYKAVSNFIVSLDITRQQNPSAIDFLYSNNLKGINATKNTQTLTFNHQLTRLIFKMNLGNGVKPEELNSANLLIKDIPAEATFNLSNAVLNPEGSSGRDIAALMNGNQATAIVYPGEAKNKEIAVILPSGEYLFHTDEQSKNWEGGYQYIYILNLEKNVDSPILEAGILPWKDGENSELNGSGNNDIAIPWDGKTSDTSWFDSSLTTFTLSNAGQLSGLAELVNNGNSFKDKTITLVRNLDFNNHPFPVIGKDEQHAFQGTFDANHHQITGYNATYTSAQNYVSLFGVNRGTIHDLIISGSVNLSGIEADSVFVGNIAGKNLGSIEGCRNYVQTQLTSSYTGKSTIYAGGIAGTTSGVLKNCQNYGYVEYRGNTDTQTSTFVGGIVGMLISGNIEQCENNQQLKASGNNVTIGGICGQRDSKTENTAKVTSNIQLCNNYGDVEASGTENSCYAGGIVGNIYDWSTLTACSNKGTICATSQSTPTSTYAGGIAGRTVQCVISKSENSGRISSTTNGGQAKAYAGGITGYLSGNSEIHTSTHTTEASVQCSDSTCGGIAGFFTSNKNSAIYSCNHNLGIPQKWIGSEAGNSQAGVNTSSHTD